MAWIFNGKEVTSETVPYDAVGFVYLIVCTDLNSPNYDRRYIGKKTLIHNRTVPKNKKELAEIPLTKKGIPNKKVKTTKKVSKESDWMTYNSSNPELKALIDENPSAFKKIILGFYGSQREMTYFEAKFLFNNAAIESNKFWNDNILGTFYKKHFNVLTDEDAIVIRNPDGKA